MDPRDQKPKFDLEKIDFEWVASTESVKELKKALRALQDDKGGYAELEKAIEEKIVRLDPSSKKPTNSLSPDEMQKLERDLQNWSEKIEKSEQLLKNEPSQEAVVNETLSQKAKEAGNDYLRAKDYDQALESYTKALSLNPKNTAAYFNRALVYLKQFKYRKAAEDCDKAILLQPDYTKAYHRRALAFMELKEYEKALEDLKKVLETDPENQEANEKLKKCRDELSSITGYRRIQITEAEDEESEQEELEKEKIEEPVDNVEEIDEIHDEKNNELESILQLQTIEDVLKELELIKSEGNGYFRNEDYDQALTLFTKAIYIIDKRYSEEFVLSTPALLNVSVAIHNNRALAYSKLDLNHEAILDCKKVLKLDKNNSKALYRMGKCQVSRGSFKQASESFKHLLQVEPSNELAKSELKDIEAKLNESSLASENLPLSPRYRLGSTEIEKVEKSFERRVSFREENIFVEESKESIKKRDSFKKGDSVFPSEKIEEDEEEKVEILNEKLKEDERRGPTPKESSNKVEISKEVVKNATEKASKLVVLDQPKNALMIESAAKSLKTKGENFYEYLTKIPIQDIQTFFEKTEFSVELLNQCVEVCDQTEIDREWANQFFSIIPATCRFSTTLKLLSKSEKTRIQNLFQRLGSTDLLTSYKLL